MGKLTRADALAVALAGPVAALIVAWLAVLAWTAANGHPVWTVRPRSLSEAAAFRDGADVVRRMSAGERTNVPAEVRPGYISGSEPVTVTALEAAARARRIEIVRLLLDLETDLDPAAWTSAWCATDDEGVRMALSHDRPAAAATTCTPSE